MSSKNQLPVPQQQQRKEGYYAWGKRKGAEKWESWKPWLEDLYLRWFSKDNKASYATRATLDKTKVTGVDHVDKAQDDVNNLVASQVGKGGLAQPVGDAISKDGVNRAERRGKDDSGQYAPGPLNSVAKPVADGGKGAAGRVGGLFGGSKK